MIPSGTVLETTAHNSTYTPSDLSRWHEFVA